MLIAGERRQTMMQDVFKTSRKTDQLLNLLRFADLVVMAGRLHPFPFRTRP